MPGQKGHSKQVSLELSTQELCTARQVGSHPSTAEGLNPLPCLAGHAALDAAQDTLGLGAPIARSCPVFHPPESPSAPPQGSQGVLPVCMQDLLLCPMCVDPPLANPNFTSTAKVLVMKAH